MAIDRCICFNVMFSTLKSYAKAHGSDTDDLRHEFGCGNGCGLCVPYINVMLKTGATSFPADQSPPHA